MESDNNKGYLIVFEGPDGVGKTTSAISLRRHLEASQRRVLFLKELHTTFLGKRLRNLVNDPKIPLSDTSIAFLFFSVRQHLNEKVIIPELNKGSIIIMDRYYHSTLAYQIRQKCKIKEYLSLIRNCSSITKPDITFMATKVIKTSTDNDRFELFDKKTKQQIKDIYLNKCFINDERIFLLDSYVDKEEFFIEKTKKLIEGGDLYG